MSVRRLRMNMRARVAGREQAPPCAARVWLMGAWLLCAGVVLEQAVVEEGGTTAADG